MEIIRTPDTSNACALTNVLYRLIEHCDKEAGLDTFPKFKELVNSTYFAQDRRTVPQTLNEYNCNRVLPCWRDTNWAITLLGMAVLCGHIDFVEFLLEKKVDPSIGFKMTNAAGMTVCDRQPIYAASANGDLELVKLLLKHNAEVVAISQPTIANTPLCAAAANGFDDICQVLIDAGADVNMQGLSNITPLYWAAQDGAVKLCDYLCKNGAVIDDPVHQGRTPLGAAAFNGHVDCIKILWSHNADPDHRDDFGYSPLMLAAQAGSLETVMFLVERCRLGNTITETCKNNQTASDRAAWHEHKDVFDYLNIRQLKSKRLTIKMSGF